MSGDLVNGNEGRVVASIDHEKTVFEYEESYSPDDSGLIPRWKLSENEAAPFEDKPGKISHII